MPTASILLVLLGAPLAAAVVVPSLAALPVGRHRRAGASLTAAAAAAAMSAVAAAGATAVVVAGGEPTLTWGGTTVVRYDALAALVVPVVALVSTTVLLYARRNLEGDERAPRFAAAAGALVGGTLVVVTAATLAVLVAGWLLASVATVALCAYRGTSVARAAAGRAARAFAVGDLALIGALATTVALVGNPDLSDLGAAAAELQGWTLLGLGPVTVTAAAAVVGLLVVAALARGGQLPLPRWLPGTVAAPTPVSALLHAGAVNAGAIVLIRTSPIAAEAPATMVALAACTLATIAVVLPAVRSHADVKGQLAEATSAQMAFMLLACAVGAPVVALTHLAGHSLYKSARFLGAGDTIRHEVSRRRWLPAPTSLHLGAAVAIGGAVAVAWAAVSGWAGAPAPERWFVGAALVALAAQATGALAGRGWAVSPSLLLVAVGAIAMAVGVALAAERLVGPALFHADAFVDPRLALLALGGLAAGTALLRRTPAGAAWLAGVTPVAATAPTQVATSLVSASTSVGPRPAQRARPRPAAGEPASAPALEGAR
ncbi:MAG: hypothetical protein JNK12_17015 [Acidimicrobiales bacterium]|nr:hypothetical protein [Acidimicrobiales bacterium]